MNKSLLAAVAAGAILLLSGCSPIQMDVEELMSPPKLTAEQAEIDSALKQALGENVKLKYPKSGDFRSAFVFHDIDGDGEEEAIVFYQLDSSTTWLTVMDRTDGQWRSTYSSSGLGDDVDFISFANVTDPQREDIVIGWSGESQGDNKVSLYTYEDGRLRSMFKDSYQQLVIVPSDEEGMDQLVLLTLGDSQSSTAKLVRKRGTRVAQSSKVDLNGKAREFAQIAYGSLPDGTKALFVDEMVSGGQMATEVLAIQNGELRNLMQEDEEETNFSATRRDIQVECMDVDGDGYLEIPTATLMPGYRELQEGERLYQVTFCSMEDGALVEKQTAAVNLSQGYMIRYPDSWNGRGTVIVQHETGEWIFVAYDGSLENSREVLLKMRVYSQNDYRDPFDMENYRLIDRKGMFEYYAYIPPEKNSRLAITYDQLEQELFQRL